MAKRKAEPQPSRHITGINLTWENWELVTAVARKRAAAGGRASISELVNQLIEAARGKLERELEHG